MVLQDLETSQNSLTYPPVQGEKRGPGPAFTELYPPRPCFLGVQTAGDPVPAAVLATGVEEGAFLGSSLP